MLDNFAEKYGYKLTAEDFINKGALHVTHMPPVKTQRDYMDFVNSFVVDFGKKLVDLVHKYGKKAYVFYDDSWVGVEPYSKRFKDFGFDGLIKCVFSGYEVRLCAGADVETKEIRLHPYLFPVGLGGLPTFAPGGDPTRDAKKYWNHTRRALLRAKIDRIGLGGYLHLVEDFPDFVDYIAKISDEFRTIKDLHTNGQPLTLGIKVAVLHSWGSLRSWTLSGHFHETYMHDLIHINEALSEIKNKLKVNDEGNIQAFIDDKDIHAKTASDIFKIPIEDVTKDMRRTAKAVNFGILYGISSFGLSEDLGIKPKEAKEFIDNYMAAYPGIVDYMNIEKKNAYDNGYVKTIMNRKRVIVELKNTNYMIRSSGERMALNTPIQGTAADILKKAMVEIYQEFNKRKLMSKMLIQVHDELVFNVLNSELDEVKEIVKNIMENTFKMRVPLKVDIEIGNNWYEAK